MPGSGGGVIGLLEAVQNDDEPTSISDTGPTTQWSQYKYVK